VPVGVPVSSAERYRSVSVPGRRMARDRPNSWRKPRNVERSRSRTCASHAGGRGFESRRRRQTSLAPDGASFVRRAQWHQRSCLAV